MWHAMCFSVGDIEKITRVRPKMKKQWIYAATLLIASQAGHAETFYSWDTSNTGAGSGDPLSYTSISGGLAMDVWGMGVGRGSGYTNQLPTLWERAVEYSSGIGEPDGSLHSVDSKGWRHDALILDFGSTSVSLEALTLVSNSGWYTSGEADKDFEVWVYQGAPDLDFTNNAANQQALGSYDQWAANGWVQAIGGSNGLSMSGTQTFRDGGPYELNTDDKQGRYWIVMAGADGSHENDAWKLAGVTAGVTPRDPRDPPPGVPAPGTLLLMGIGAVALRQRLKQKPVTE